MRGGSLAMDRAGRVGALITLAALAAVFIVAGVIVSGPWILVAAAVGALFAIVSHPRRR